MKSIILAVSDTVESDIVGYEALSNEDKYFSLLKASITNLFSFIGTDREKIFPYITDYVSIEAAALGREGYGQAIRDANQLGLTGIQSHIVDLGGASVAGAIGEAARLAENNPYAVVLVAGADVPKSAFKQISDLKRLTQTVAHPSWEIPYGATLIGMYALLANKQMQDHGITQDEYNSITKFFRNQAIDNPRAFYYKKEITEKQIAKHLANPYSTPMIAIVTDHGFATLVVGESIYEELIQNSIVSQPNNKLYIVGSGHTVHAEYFSLKGGLESPSGSAAEIAFSQSGMERSDTEYAWIYDCFTGMIITQASQYFGESPKLVASSLKEGKIPIGNKRIPINLGGGILNYQAAMSMSGAAGLVDILTQYSLSNSPIPNKLNHPPKLSLLGNNGGIDSINSVVLFSTMNPGEKPRFKPKTKSKLQLNPVQDIELLAKSATSKHPLIGHILSSTLITFNPGGEKKPPYILVLVALDSGGFVMANLYHPNGEESKNTSSLSSSTKVQLVNENGLWKGILLEVKNRLDE